ncbi:MAG: hypothetical protein H0T56_13400 [Pseudaminobacter sp.]|nr:hypothetical protein [Pseudaminobacter sp.]
MNPDNEWDLVRNDRGHSFELAGTGILRLTLLFGSATVALALIAVSLIAEQGDSRIARAGYGVDMMSTGTIGHKSSYTIRRSVLQASPNSVCIIRASGVRSGDC